MKTKKFVLFFLYFPSNYFKSIKMNIGYLNGPLISPLLVQKFYFKNIENIDMSYEINGKW